MNFYSFTMILGYSRCMIYDLQISIEARDPYQKHWVCNHTVAAL